MLEAADYQFRLGMLTKDGGSTREKLETKEEKTGYRDPALDEFPYPEATCYLVNWFGQIAAGRTNAGFGPSSLSAAEILAWSRLTGTRLTPWEFRAIRSLDSLWLKTWSDFQAPE